MDLPPRACRFPLPVVALLLAAACSEDEPIGVHVALRADGSGVIACRSLELAQEAGPMETGSQGIEWQDRARLAASRGTFERIDHVRLADLEWKSAEHGLRLTLPLGAGAAWLARLAPPEAARDKAAVVFDPANPAARAGGTILFEIEAPAEITAVGHAPAMRLVKSDKDGRKAVLSVSVETASRSGGALVFDVAWR